MLAMPGSMFYAGGSSEEKNMTHSRVATNIASGFRHPTYDGRPKATGLDHELDVRIRTG